MEIFNKLFGREKGYVGLEEKQKRIDKLRAKRNIKGLIKALGDRDWYIRQASAIALGKIGDSTAVEPLIQLLNDKKGHVRSSAVYALGEIGDERAVEPLLQSREVSTNESAIVDALGKIGGIEATRYLMQRLKGPHGPDFIMKIVRALSKLVELDAIELPIETLIEDLTDEKGVGDTRRQAAFVLGEIGDARAAKPLARVSVFEAVNVHLSGEANIALAKMVKRGVITEVDVEELQMACQGEYEKEAKREWLLEFFPSDEVSLEGLRQILTTEPEFVHLRYERGETALFLVIEDGPEFVSLLLDAGADVNSENQVGKTPLHQAAEDHNGQVAQLLIDYGADVDAPDQHGKTPLHAAALHGASEVAEVLVRNGAKANCRDEWGYTPLHYSVFGFPVSQRNEYQKVTEVLLRAGADPNARTNDQVTALGLARRFDNQGIIALLVQYGAKEGG